MLGFNKCVGCWKEIEGSKAKAQENGWFKLTMKQDIPPFNKYTAMLCPDCTKKFISEYFYGRNKNEER